MNEILREARNALNAVNVNAVRIPDLAGQLAIDEQTIGVVTKVIATIDKALEQPAQQERKPLTDEQIQELSLNHKFDSRMKKFVRIIEQAHGIGSKT